MRILFLTHHYPNYVPDLLLHGLRKLIGPDVVDFPRKDCLYEGVLGLGICTDDQLIPGWFPDDAGVVDRGDLEAKVKAGFFDLVVCDYRSLPLYTTKFNTKAQRLAIIDGEDRARPVPAGRYALFRRETDGTDHSIPLPMSLPEEIFNWISSHDQLPKRYSIGFLGSTQADERRRLVDQLTEWYPDALLHATDIPSDEVPMPDGRMGRDAYYRSLQQCRVVLSLPGAGWDTFRFWENAACNSVHAARRIPLFVPDAFRDGLHLLEFDRIREMRYKLDRMLAGADGGRSMIPAGRHHLLNHHLTVHRARYFIDRANQAFTH
jgi:hypothetical protein